MAESCQFVQSRYDDDDDDDEFLLNSPFSITQSLSSKQKQKTINDFIKQVEYEKFEINLIDNQSHQQSSDKNSIVEKFFDEEIVYLNCPICMKSLKNINHIKKCALKFNIPPKESIYNLRKIRKFTRSKMKKITNCNQRKTQHLGTSLKQRKTLLVDDPNAKKLIFEKNVSRFSILDNRIFSDYNDNDDNRQQLDDLPQIWLASCFDKNCSQFILAGFEKYFQQ
ncbi:hypothetical protein DERP_013496 [Dermatophagoides pteronyssinus]|uniref:Uncharacterized protein n=1 Tax=Dermatophagoides pteronyssinus TaxID=6956 RepID=A0ABQ8IXJ2_DERPT|nr:hypothetical protein DERP_013496 [Dermatophagoides pteronyssinus]